MNKLQQIALQMWRDSNHNWGTVEPCLQQGISLKSNQGGIRMNYRGCQCAKSTNGDPTWIAF